MSTDLVEYEEGKNEKLYYWAPEGDKDNLVYGELYRMKIPNYNHNSALCLGLQQAERVYYDKNERVYVSYKLHDKGSNKQIPRYCFGQYAKEFRKTANVRKIIGKRTKTAKYKEFLGVTVPKEELQVTVQEEEEMDYEKRIFQQNKEFNERTRNEPTNEELWHLFIAFQDEFHSAINEKAGNKVSAVAVLEKKRSIYLEALEYNPDSISLLLGYINCCQQLWDKDKVIALWASTLSSKAENVSLWQHYIAFIQSNFSYFTVTECRAVYLKAINAMHSLKLRAERVAGSNLLLFPLSSRTS